MSPNERDLFTKIAEAVNPDWKLTLRDWQPGGDMPMADLRVFVYALDTSNGWVTGAAATRDELERQAAAVGALPTDEKRAILGGAGFVVMEASDAGAEGSSQLAENAVKAAMMAITLSQTYTSALAARRSPAWKDQDDHFAYLIYRGTDGRAIGRPIWAGHQGPGFLSTEMLLQWVKLAVAHDTRSSASTVGRMLKEQGGARLHESFRR